MRRHGSSLLSRWRCHCLRRGQRLYWGRSQRDLYGLWRTSATLLWYRNRRESANLQYGSNLRQFRDGRGTQLSMCSAVVCQNRYCKGWASFMIRAIRLGPVMLSLCACACSSNDQSNYSYNPTTGGTTNSGVGGNGTQGGGLAVGGNAQPAGGTTTSTGSTARNTGGVRPITTGGRAAIGGGIGVTGGAFTGSTGGGAASGTVTCTCSCTCLTASCSGPTTRTCQAGDTACANCRLPCVDVCGGPSDTCAGISVTSGTCVTNP